MTRKRKILIVVLPLPMLVLLAIAGEAIYFGNRYRPGVRPACHNNLNMTLHPLMDGASYPNVEGSSAKTMALMVPELDNRLSNYRYIPGLREDDPEDLVLFYMAKKTRYSAHFDNPSLWVALSRKPKWMVLGPSFFYVLHDDPRRAQEGGLLLDTDEFRAMLERTLKFLQENNRPSWQVVVEEHREFLDWLKKQP